MKNKKGKNSRVSTGLVLHDISPKTQNQQKAFASENNLVLHGVPGTGKTFISMYIALDDILNAQLYRRLVVIRSCVPTRDVGFLPGKLEEKYSVYEEPYKAICSELFNRGDAYEILKQKGAIEFMTTSFIRGITLDNCVILVDEYQNMSFHELDSIITRVGENSKIIFSGDYEQSDLPVSGLKDFMEIIKHADIFDFVEFSVDDMVRSGLVAKYIKAKIALGKI